MTISVIIVFGSFIIASCNGGSNEIKDGDKVQNTSNAKDSKLNEDSKSGTGKSIGIDNTNLSRDTIAELLNQLKNIPIGDNYIIKGELKTDILKYKSMEFCDLLHLGFIDKNNKEYDFNGEISKVELYKGATNPSDENGGFENGGYEANKKYLNKNFRVVWRTLKLKHKPKDVMDMYYEEFNEIIYLKQIN